MVKRIRVTLREAQRQAREHGMTIRKTSAGDYRVSFKSGSEASACYEATIQDAVDTAKHMWNSKHKYRY